ncbi:MAG TPA: hypothetical protein PK191_06020 [Niabella sp.]|nr:hypothetical protein [Niabella sp.]HOZ96283.1 hypothetical protein [Niabella sp.]HQW14643.1 hypothetical protein [Niabella sp.]HQX19782.1 hypothetical protein [Niabella sp.]HQX41118.1 hypothetical protein [Niabella sp.]
MSPTLGAQIWALRNLLSSNPARVLEQLAIAGFDSIEPAGFNSVSGKMQGIELHVLRNVADDFGLKMHSGHFPVLEEDTDPICETALALGMKYVVCPTLVLPRLVTVDFYKTIADELNRKAEILKVYGLQLVYHNHAFEFEKIEEKLPFDILLNETDPSTVFFQADLAWIVKGGYNPPDYFQRYPNRFPLWHIRNEEIDCTIAPSENQDSIDFQRILNQHKISGLKHAFIEIVSGLEQPFDILVSGLRRIKTLQWP